LGRAILSGLPVATQRAILSANPPRRLTDHTLINIEKILEEIVRAKELGYAVSEQETVVGLRVIAAPITDIDGVPIAGMSAAAPVFGRTLKQFVADAKGPVCEGAARLSLALRAAGGMAAQQPAA
jgi:IclR family pca regulon transcriptional regulator